MLFPHLPTVNNAANNMSVSIALQGLAFNSLGYIVRRGIAGSYDKSPGEGNSNPLQNSCLENPMDRGAWWAIVQRVAKSRTKLSGLTYDKSIFYFLKSHHTVFHSSLTILHSHEW